MREALLFCFNEEIGCRIASNVCGGLWRHALSETTCRDWFRRINDDNFDLSDKKRENWPRKVEDSNAGSFGRGQYPIVKNACRAIVFLKQPFPCNYMPWGRFKRSENGCRMNWMIGKWRDAKTHAKFCLSDKKESCSCIGLWQVMKRGSIFRILNARNLGLIPPNHQHLPQDQIASDGRRCCAFDGSGGCHLLRAVKIWWKCSPLPPTTDQIAPCSAWKKAALSEKTWQADFPPRQRTIAHVNNAPKLLGDTQLGSATSSRLLTRPGTFWLSPVFVDGPRVRWAVLRFLRRRPKMAWWVICLERWGIFLAWYTQIAR